MMNNKKQMAINIFARALGFIISFGISFFLSPYIVKNIGVDAYGFVGLAANFTTYATLITIAVSSMAGRFITIKIYEKDMEGASKYYSSVFVANFFLSGIVAVILLFVLIFLEKIINIPQNIFWDVKILFALLFSNCVISTFGSVFGVAPFATNKLYISSIRGIVSDFLRILIILPLFVFLTPRVSFLGTSALICGVYVVIFDFYCSKRLLPNLKIKKKYFDFNAVKELVAAGIWNLITKLGQILLDGLDLLITNLFINPAAMGVLSLSKTVPTIINGIVSSIAGVFSPNFTILYAEKKIDELLKSVKQSIKIMGVITNIPVIGLIVCGDIFYKLWQPTQDANQLQILSLLACSCIIFSGGINCIYSIFTVVNKLKLNSLVVIFSGALNAAIVFVLVNTTNLGIYAIAGVSAVLSIVRNLCFTAPYGAHCLGQKWYIFYPSIFKPVLFVLISSAMGIFIKSFFNFNTWVGFLLMAVITVIISLVIGLFVMLNKNERMIIFSKLRRRN